MPRFFVRPDHYANPSYFYAEHLISHDSVQLGTLHRVPRLGYLRVTMSKQATSPAPVDTSILDSSPEQSPRRSWRHSRRTPAPEPVRQRSSRRSRYSSASSHFRSLRETAPLTDSPSRQLSTRGRAQSARDRSPLASSAPSRTVQAPSLLTLPLPPRPVGLSESTSARPPRAPVPRDLRSKLAARGLPRAPSPQPPAREPSPQPGTSTGIRHSPFNPYRLLGSSESTLTAPSPPRQSTRRLVPSSPEVLFVAPPPPRRSRSPTRAPRPRSPPRRVTTREHAPTRTPPRPATDYTQFPRTPGYSSPEPDPVLDLTRLPRPVLPRASSPSASETPWDHFSPEPEAPAPVAPPEVPQPEAPLSWGHVVDIVFNSGLINSDCLPKSPEPVQSVIGGPQPSERRRLSLPPSPLAAAALPAAMRSCWGGPWSSSAQHQPPPPTRLYTQVLRLGCLSSARGSTPAQVSTCAPLDFLLENGNGPALLNHQWNIRGWRT